MSSASIHSWLSMSRVNTSSSANGSASFPNLTSAPFFALGFFSVSIMIDVMTSSEAESSEEMLYSVLISWLGKAAYFTVISWILAAPLLYDRVGLFRNSLRRLLGLYPIHY